MTQKLHHSLILLSLVLYMPLLQAMDMDKVNALAEQIRAGRVTQPVTPKAADTSMKKDAKPVVKEEIPAVSETKSNTSILSQNEVSEESLGLRKTDLYTEENTKPSETKYSEALPGTSKRTDRAFENAPPMIPHSVDGLLPIMKGNNACLGCHMPDVAPSMNATPIPPSHFTNFRPMTKINAEGKMLKEGVMIANTSDIKIVARQEDKLYQGRFNCSQCHAPQAEIKPLVGNTFEPEFRKPEEKQKSNLIDVINEGVE